MKLAASVNTSTVIHTLNTNPQLQNGLVLMNVFKFHLFGIWFEFWWKKILDFIAFYSFYEKEHFVALDKISLEIFALFSCLFLFWCCCVFVLAMYPLHPLFIWHHSFFGPFGSEMHRCKSEAFQETCTLPKHTVTTVVCFLNAIFTLISKKWSHFELEQTKTWFEERKHFFVSPMACFSCFNSRWWFRKDYLSHCGSASWFWLIWPFFWRGEAGAGLPDLPHAGGRPSAVAAAAALSLILTHVERTNLTVATAQILVIFIHNMVIINWCKLLF